jgi:hypothetical protein
MIDLSFAGAAILTNEVPFIRTVHTVGMLIIRFISRRDWHSPICRRRFCKLLAFMPANAALP